MFVSQIIDEASEVLATTDQKKVFRKLTQAVQTLMESGHYFHTNMEVDVCTGWDGQTITLPRGIEVPLAVNIDGSPQYFRGRLFQYHVNKGGMYNSVPWAWDDRGFVSTMMDIRQPSQLVAIAEHQADAGLSLRVIGTDKNNRELRSQDDNGQGMDGIIVPIHAQSDFPLGSIIPDGVTIKTRATQVNWLYDFVSNTAHQLSDGQQMVLSKGSGVIPSLLIAGNTYYVGVESSTTVRLYNSAIDAKNKVNAIPLQSIVGSNTVNLTDTRNVNLKTTVQLLPSAPYLPVALDSPNEITFSSSTDVGFSGSLPSPLQAGVTYFAQAQDATNVQIYASLNDAQNNSNPVYMNGSSGKFYADLRKPISAQTTLVFSVPHLYQNGDEVQAYTSGGTLPSPLIEGQNYFVHVIDQYTVTIHATQPDSVSGLNPISMTDTGTGTNSLVKLVTATSKVGTTGQINAPGISIATPTGSGAQFTANVVGSVVNVSVQAGGSKYTSAPAITFDPPPPAPAGTSQTVSTATGYAVMVPDAVNSITYAIGSIVITNAGLGYTTAPKVSIDPPPSGGTQASATCKIQTSFVSSFTQVNSGVGYLNPPQVVISGGGGSGATAVATIDSSINNIRTLVASNGIVTATTTTDHGYSSNTQVVITGASPQNFNGTYPITVPSGSTNTFTYQITAGYTGSATGTITCYTGKVTAVTVITEGTGYTSTPAVTIQPSTGVFVEFSSTGNLPAPLTSGTAYRAEKPAGSGPGVFTIVNADFTPVNITGSPTGNFYVALSRAFGIGFNSRWSGDFAGIQSPQDVYLASDYLLPTGVSTGTKYSMRVVDSNSTVAQLYDSSGNLVNVISLGTGQAYYAIRIPAYAQVYNNLIVPDSIQNLTEGMSVQFSSTGDLPYPLSQTPGGIYTISLKGNSLSLKDSFGSTVVFVQNSVPSLGNGQMQMYIQRAFIPQASTSLLVPVSIHEDGDQVTVRPGENDRLPTPLVQTSATVPQYYYTRNSAPGQIQLYTTRNGAITGDPTTLVSFLDTGNTVTSTFFVDSILAPTLVKAVIHVEKPITQGYISLYALDYGRSNDMALIGQYHPSETNPKYRRIRIGKACAWARILYRVKAPEITSVYDYIPIENSRAIIAAVHACDLEDKDFFDQAQRYWATAIGYLRNQHESMDGHSMQPPQINNITYGDYTDEVMF